MAGIQANGIGSGLDINGLVTQLITAERAPLQGQITRQQTSVATEISALGALKGSLSAFQSALGQLKTIDAFKIHSAKSSDEEVFVAAANARATAGTYDVEVRQLAQAQQLSSDPFAAGSDESVGTGTLTITVAGVGFSINVGSENRKLSEIRDAINASADNKAVRATIVNAQDGAHLVLTAMKSGAANRISIAASGGDGGLSRLVHDQNTSANFTELKEAKDSIVRVATYEHRSATRTIENVVDGVTLTLLKDEPDNILTLTVGNDTAAVTSRVKSFVDQFNALQSQMTSLRHYEPSTNKAGPLLGDALLRSIEAEVRRNLTGVVGGLEGEYRSLATIGITTTREGTLQLDAAKLKIALEDDFDSVAAVFGSEGGVAARLSAAIEPRLAATGEIALRNKGLTDRTSSLQKEQAALELRMARIEERYRKQFTALDGLLSQMQSTSSYLAQQLANLPKIGE
jgi:flagellar hook-associated protein 2